MIRPEFQATLAEAEPWKIRFEKLSFVAFLCFSSLSNLILIAGKCEIKVIQSTNQFVPI